MDVTKTIVKSLNGYIFNLSEKISQEYNIPLEEILTIWCDQQNISFTNTFVPMLKITKKQKKIDQEEITSVLESFTEEDDELLLSVNESPISTSSEINNTKENNIINKDSKTCEYIFIRGPKKDKQCTIMAKTGNLCSKHKNSK